MDIPTAASIIAITYGALLVLWLVTWPFARRRFVQKAFEELRMICEGKEISFD